jgi:predicted dehydrogenase
MAGKKPDGMSRRQMIKSAAVASAALMANLGSNFAHAAGTDLIRVGLIGCGGRGSGAAVDATSAAENVRVVALGDLFPNRIAEARKRFADRPKERFDITDDRCFSGWDAYKQVLECGVDMVILATPPAFRPMHIKAAVEAGKHIFAEKPCAVDPVGVRMVMEASDLAKQKGLAIVAGTQRRHQASYIETIRRIKDGAIGELVAGQCYWNQGGLWSVRRTPEMSDMEWQVRNWLYFTWLSGDHIVEQHVHNIDVMNWVIGAHPVSAYGMGGRQVRTGEQFGHIYDHFTIEYVYPNDVRVMSMCRQIDNNDNRIGEYIMGTQGRSNCSGQITGANAWRFQGRGNNPSVQEHTDLIASIRAGTPLNEGRQIAESTLTAIMGRMSAYTGKTVRWEQALNSTLNLMPEKLEFGPLPTPEVAMPGRTPLV